MFVEVLVQIMAGHFGSVFITSTCFAFEKMFLPFRFAFEQSFLTFCPTMFLLACVVLPVEMVRGYNMLDPFVSVCCYFDVFIFKCLLLETF